MRIEGLSVHYLGRESWVLDSAVSLTHLRGRVTAVIGPSGCGKTTLVRALCGLIPHCLPSEYSGSLSLDSTEVADATVQTLAETVAYVGQSPDAAVALAMHPRLLVLVSGVSTDPEALIRTLTTTFHMPYRLGAAGIASIAFITRFQDDFVLLRTARALRGVGDRWGPLAPVVRWIGSILPLMILAIQHAERVALSMDSRAFGAHRRRTEMTDEPWRARDWGVVVLTWALVAFTWNTLR